MAGSDAAGAASYIAYEGFSLECPLSYGRSVPILQEGDIHMPIPFFPLVGDPANLTLLDPMIIFTPLTFSLVLLSTLCGLAFAILLDGVWGARTEQPDTLHSESPTLPKAA